MSEVASPPPVPIPAASLILLRQADGVEVLVGHRSLSTRAFPGAIVFPGGKLEVQDAAWPRAQGDVVQTARHAALREAFEETGLLVDAAGDGPPPGANVGLERRRVEGGEVGFAELLQRWDSTLDPERLTPFAHWITPDYSPYRFDTFFFLVAASPYEAQASLICAEFEQLNWMRPEVLLAQEARRLMTPTRHCLEVLRGASTVSEAVQAACARGIIEGDAVRTAHRRR